MNPLAFITNIQGYRTYILGWILLVDAAYFLLTGDKLLTGEVSFDNPNAGLDPATQGIAGGALLSLRSAIQSLQDSVKSAGEAAKNIVKGS